MSQKITKFFAPATKRTISIEEEISKSAKKSEFETEIVVQNCSIIVKDIKDDIRDGRYEGMEIVEGSQLEFCTNGPAQNKSSCIKTPSSSECQICSKTLASKRGLIRHIKKLHQNVLGDSLLKCSICDEKFTRKESLTKHMNAKHPYGKIFQFECDFCGKVFNTKISIYHHMPAHLPVVECHICGIEVKYIRHHLRDIHATEKNFKCEICPASFKSRTYLSRHAKTHDKKFVCETCGKKFIQQFYLQKHQQETHENPGRFTCDKCDKSFNRKDHLKQHQKVHDRFRQKPFKCQKCSYSTDLKQSYEKHQKVHQRQEERFAAIKNPVKCEKCGKFNRDKKALNHHMRSVHPLEKFQCDLCGKYTKTMFELKEHIKRHL